MTSVCQVKSRLSHEMLMSQAMSSLSSYADDDSGSEKALDSEKGVLPEQAKQLYDNGKNDSANSEFSIANILGFQGKKAEKTDELSSEFSKWPPRPAAIRNQSFIKEETIAANLSSKESSKIKIEKAHDSSDNNHNQHKQKDAKNLENIEHHEKSRRPSDPIKKECFKFTGEAAMRNISEQSGKHESEDIDLRHKALLERFNSAQLDPKREELSANSAWASALNSYYESLTPTWRMWQDLIIRRTLPVASNHQQPGFHPYLRRLPGMANSSPIVYNNLSSLPSKLESAKTKTGFQLANQGIHSLEDLSRANESKEFYFVLRRKSKATVILKTGRFDGIDSTDIISSVSKAVQTSMLSKRTILRITVALIFPP